MKKWITIILVLTNVLPVLGGTPGVSGLDEITLASIWLLLFIVSLNNTISLFRETLDKE